MAAAVHCALPGLGLSSPTIEKRHGGGVNTMLKTHEDILRQKAYADSNCRKADCPPQNEKSL